MTRIVQNNHLPSHEPWQLFSPKITPLRKKHVLPALLAQRLKWRFRLNVSLFRSPRARVQIHYVACRRCVHIDTIWCHHGRVYKAGVLSEAASFKRADICHQLLYPQKHGSSGRTNSTARFFPKKIKNRTRFRGFAFFEPRKWQKLFCSQRTTGIVFRNNSLYEVTKMFLTSLMSWSCGRFPIEQV